jgi:peptide methionine sulfoxide reductase MsrB
MQDKKRIAGKSKGGIRTYGYYQCIYCQKRIYSDKDADKHIANPGWWCKFIEKLIKILP